MRRWHSWDDGERGQAENEPIVNIISVPFLILSVCFTYTSCPVVVQPRQRPLRWSHKVQSLLITNVGFVWPTDISIAKLASAFDKCLLVFALTRAVLYSVKPAIHIRDMHHTHVSSRLSTARVCYDVVARFSFAIITTINNSCLFLAGDNVNWSRTWPRCTMRLNHCIKPPYHCRAGSWWVHWNASCPCLHPPWCCVFVAKPSILQWWRHIVLIR